jgi:hypothetical protein
MKAQSTTSSNVAPSSSSRQAAQRIMTPSMVIALSLGFVSCSTIANQPAPKERKKPAGELREKCRTCGTIHEYAASFDDSDYALIADFCDGFRVKKQVSYRAPHGPNPSCSSTYAANLPWDYLRKEMPALRRDTFESFKRRNTPIPTHEGSEDIAKRRGISIVHSPADAYDLTRAGFSGNRQQALIYSGGGVMYLLERKGTKWRHADSCVLWIS